MLDMFSLFESQLHNVIDECTKLKIFRIFIQLILIITIKVLLTPIIISIDHNTSIISMCKWII